MNVSANNYRFKPQLSLIDIAKCWPKQCAQFNLHTPCCEDQAVKTYTTMMEDVGVERPGRRAMQQFVESVIL